MANTAYDLLLRVNKHDERIGAVEKIVAVNSNRLSELEDCTDELEKEMKEMREVLISSKMAIKIGTWIVAGFGVSAIALIWSMITGQASILFK